MRLIIFLTVLLTATLHVSAQTSKSGKSSLAKAGSVSSESVRPLTVGDKVPDLSLGKIINYTSKSAKLSDFPGKIVIIDFWGTYCTSCIYALGVLDSLQKIYKDKIQILTVTDYDSEEKVRNTLDRYEKTRNLGLPIILNDKLIKKYFPFEIISHVVWIGPDGIVKAITGTDYVSASNIDELLKNKKVNWPIKNDIAQFDYEKPLLGLSNQEVKQPQSLYYSAFTGYIDGIDATERVVVDSVNNKVVMNYFNHTLLQLCDGSLSGSGTGYIDPANLILRVNDPGRFIQGDDEYATDWFRKNTYTYSITLPLGLSEQETQEIIKGDLSRWLLILGYTVKKEKDTYIITENAYDRTGKK